MIKNIFLVVCSVLLGCGPSVNEADFSASSLGSARMTAVESTPSYVKVRRDNRKCAFPLCGGYFVQHLNQPNVDEVYVRAFDFEAAGLDEASLADLKAANADEWALHGQLGAVDPETDTRLFLVDEAYLGMPGVRSVDGESFATTEKSQIACIRGPCPSLKATHLNTETEELYHGLVVDRSARTLVDQRWMNHLVTDKKAIVSFAPLAAGNERNIDASQIYVKLPFREDPCPKVAVPVCEGGESNIFVRNVNRCIIPQGCSQVEPDTGAAPPCDEGYIQVAWQTAEGMQYACDPAFSAR